MSEMVERVAKAIFEQAIEARPLTPLGMTRDVMTWEDASETDKKFARGEARAAIAAMRTPTEAMESAAYEYDDSGAQLSCVYDEIYTVMIDAALK